MSRRLMAAAALSGGALAAPLAAQATLDCAALASTVEWGLIDGGEGGDTSGLTAVVRADGPAACRARLDGAGFGAGLDVPACAEAFALFWQVGPPPSEADPPALLYDLLSGEAPDTCAALLSAY